MLILDEVMTGFGRTGKMFGYEHWDVEADIIALSKGMAAGYCPLGAVMTRCSIVNPLLNSGGFMHGYTYAGNPLACAVGREVLDIIIKEDLCNHASQTGTLLKAGLDSLARRYPIIGQVRGKGLLWGLEFVEDKNTRRPFAAALNIAQRLTDLAFKEGLIIYPRRSLNGLAGDHVLVAPPLIITSDEVSKVLRRLECAMDLLMEELDR